MRAALATALALAACGRAAPLTDEVRARERFLADLMAREGLGEAWGLQSRATIQFEDGFGRVEEIDPLAPFATWREVPHACASAPALFVRFIGSRARLRVRADGSHPMHLAIRGRVDLAQIHTRPLVTATLDGAELHAALVDPDGYFHVEATVPRDRLRAWSDLHLTLSSVHEPWGDPSGATGFQLRVAWLEHVTWEPAGAGRE